MSLSVNANGGSVSDSGLVATDPTVGISLFLESDDGHGAVQFSVSLSTEQARSLARELIAAADRAPTLPPSTWSGSVAEMIARERAGVTKSAGGSSDAGGDR